MRIGDRIVGWAGDGEQVEAVVVHSRDTEIRVYEGEVEPLSSAESQGVGIRVVRDQRVGFAYAGTLDDDVLAETLAEARDNAGFGTPDEFVGLAEPDGVPVADLDLYRESLADRAHRRKVELASSSSEWLAAPTRASPASSRPTTPTRSSAAAVVTTTGIRVGGTRDGRVRVRVGAGRRGRRDADRLRLLGRPPPRRARPRRRRERRGRARHPHARRDEAAERAA